MKTEAHRRNELIGLLQAYNAAFDVYTDAMRTFVAVNKRVPNAEENFEILRPRIVAATTLQRFLEAEVKHIPADQVTDLCHEHLSSELMTSSFLVSVATFATIPT